MFSTKHLFGISLLLGLALSAPAADTNSTSTPILFILDASGSMWGRLGSVEKIVVAKGTLIELVGSLEDEQRLGLIAYGHRHEGDCDDIELMAPIASEQRASVIASIQSVNPKGKTPIVRALKEAAAQIQSLNEEVAVILVSDGKETCDEAPCDFVKTLRQRGVRFTLYVIGLDVTKVEKEELHCLATAGGGSYVSAGSAAELQDALRILTAQAFEATTMEPGILVVTASGNSLYTVYDAAGKERINAARTNNSVKLEPGFYRISLGGSTQLVMIKAGQETRLGAGSIIVSGLGKALFSVFDVTGSEKVDFTRTNHPIDVLEGSYLVELNGTRRVAVVEADKTTTIKAASILVTGDSGDLYALFDPTGTTKYEFTRVGLPIEVLPGFYSLKIGDRWVRDINLNDGEQMEITE